MTLLTADLSDSLLRLSHANEALVDGVELGPWFTTRQIRQCRSVLPRLPFYFHGGDLIQEAGFIPGAASRIDGYLRATESPWLSLHIMMWLPGMIWLMRRWGWKVPLPNPERATKSFIRRVSTLAHAVRVPVLLENDEPPPFDGYEFEVRPDRITHVLDATGCGLLLDIAHARLSAERLGMDVHAYLGCLPLQRVLQIHLSGPRTRRGRLFDAHETLQDMDYRLLDFVLGQTHPKVITLEYIREPEALRAQLRSLRAILGARSG